MRTVKLLTIALFAAASMSPGMAASNSSSTTVAPLQRVASSCGAELSVCLQSHSQKGAYGESYVPPDDAAACHAAYRQCTGHR